MVEGLTCSQNSATTERKWLVHMLPGTNRFLCVYSLCSAEGHLKVLPAVAGAQGAVVEGFRKEIVHERTKCHAIAPTG